MRLLFPTVILAAIGMLLFLPVTGAATLQEPDDEISTQDADDPVAELYEARQQMQLSHLRMAAMLTDHNLGMVEAQNALAAAQSALQAFVEYEAEIETATARLELEQAKDDLSDAEEELAQLAIMYERNALADATAQIVMQRAARAIERQKSSVAISEKSFNAWLAFGLANQQQELGHAMTHAQASLEATVSAQELERAELEMEIRELEKQIVELEVEVAKNSTESDD